MALLTLKTEKRWRRSSEPDRMFPYALWALDKKDITMKKPKKLGTDYYNYKGFLSGAASPGQHKIQIPLGQCGVKWIFIRCIDF